MSARANPKLALRPYLPADAPLLVEIFRASIEELTAEDYNGAQRGVWAAAADDEAAFGARLAQGLTLVATLGGSVVGFVALKGTPEDRLKVLEDNLLKSMKGQMYSTYIETSGQAPDSVAPRAAWQAQLDAMYKEADAALTPLATAPT